MGRGREPRDPTPRRAELDSFFATIEQHWAELSLPARAVVKATLGERIRCQVDLRAHLPTSDAELDAARHELAVWAAEHMLL